MQKLHLKNKYLLIIIMIEEVDICCGLAWGDEAKGKIVTELLKKKHYDWVCRWSGGSNKESLFVLEINTQPGMTSTSLVPELLENKGISYNDLILYLLEDASCRR